MIWVSHDLLSNFNGSVASGDTEMTLSIFKSELSDLIVYNIDKLFELFDKVGIKYSKNTSDEVIVGKVLNEMNTNAKFVRGLSFLIAENNDVIKQDKSKVTAALKKIGIALKKINTGFVNSPKSKQLFQAQILEMITTKANKVGNRNRTIKKKDYTALWIFGIVAFSVGSYILYEYMRKKRIEKALKSSVAVPKMELGGKPMPSEITPPQPAQVPQSNAVPSVSTEVKPKINVNDPAFNVSPDVLIPASPVTPAPTTVVNIGQQAAVNQPSSNQVPLM